MIFDPLIDTNQSNVTANNIIPNNINAQQAFIQMQQQQQISSTLLQQTQLPSNTNMFYALQSAAFLNYHFQQQQQQQQSKLNRIQQIHQQQLMISQNSQNPYFMELLTRNSETINSNNKSKIPEQLIKAHQQFASGRYVNNLMVNSDSNKNENIDNKVHKENLELSTLKFYKEVEQSMNAKLNQNLNVQQAETNSKVNENVNYEESMKLLSKLNSSKRPLLKFGMDSILGNNSSNSSISSVQSTPSASPTKKICTGMR
jgi:hypothetical protein